VLHQHDDLTFTARVWVSGKLLLPDCVACGRDTTLSYIAAGLLDASHGDDRLVLRAQGQGVLRTFETREASLAMAWLAEQMAVGTCEGGTAEGARSGTRPIASATAAEVDRHESAHPPAA